MMHLVRHVEKELKHHFFDYSLLFTGGVIFLILLGFFSGERLASFTIVLMFTSFYILWGIFHHGSTKTIHIKNVVEYISIGFIVLFLVIVLITL